MTSSAAIALSTALTHQRFPCHTSGSNLASINLKAVSEDDLAKLKAASAAGDAAVTPRAPVDVVAVIDRSGSMAGEKLRLVKVALEFMVGQLKATDRAGIVTYDTNVAVPVPPTLLTDASKKKVLEVVRKIEAGDSTNLSGGLFEGLAQISSMSRSVVEDSGTGNRVASVFLFTDGMANSGLQSLAEITPILRSMLDGKNYTVFTFGFGSDHDAQLLKGLAEVGRGMYYFMAHADDIPVAFADCLGGLLSVVAQNIELEFEVVGNSCAISRLLTRFPVTTHQPQRRVSVHVNDIYADESKDLLVDLMLSSLSQESLQQPLLTVRLRYMDVVLSKLETCETTIHVDRTKHEKLDTPNLCVDEQRNRYNVATALDEANALGSKGDLKAAKLLLQQVGEELAAGPSNGSAITLELKAQVQQIGERLSSAEEYHAYGSKAMAQIANEHFYQRSAISSAVPQIGSVPSAPRYVNRSKEAMRFAVASPQQHPPGSGSAGASAAATPANGFRLAMPVLQAHGGHPMIDDDESPQ